MRCLQHLGMHFQFPEPSLLLRSLLYNLWHTYTLLAVCLLHRTDDTTALRTEVMDL